MRGTFKPTFAFPVVCVSLIVVIYVIFLFFSVACFILYVYNQMLLFGQSLHFLNSSWFCYISHFALSSQSYFF